MSAAKPFTVVEDQAAEDEMVAREVDRERLRRRAKALVDAEEAPPLTWWDIDELLASPMPEPLVPDFLYRDSLARVFGPAGGGKSFLVLDLALRVALGMPWAGRRVHQGPVVYVMAEGQAVNNARVQAWLDHHKIDPKALRGKFITVPHAVVLSAPGLHEFLPRVRELGPVLVILDTKNAMMVGNEDSASEFAPTRRVLEAIRRSCGCCCVLVDHTGHGNTDRARGSSAVEAAMDTEVRVQKDRRVVTATVTRDKAGEAGTKVAFDLRWHPPAAVLQVSRADPPADRDRDWRAHELPERLRAEVAEYEGAGAKHVVELARYMAAHANADADPARVGISRAEALTALGLSKNGAARSAWSWLLDGSWLVPGDGQEATTARHIWSPVGGGR